MDISSFLSQLLNGLASASSIFLIAAGLSLIFGVTRVVNFAHGSFFMLGLYLSYSLVSWGTQFFAWAFWPCLILTSLAVALLGMLIEVFVLRRLYASAELFQLLATFALVLLIQDAALWCWGAQDLLGPRAPGLAGAVTILGRKFPSYDIFLIFCGPLVLCGLWWLLHRTRFGALIRAASQDREMLGALGVAQSWLFTAVFGIGCALAGLAGALELPKEPANLSIDLTHLSDAFVVVVMGGLGSIPGAYAASVLIGEIKAICNFIGTVEIAGLTLSFSKLTLVIEFVVLLAILSFKPNGLMGRPRSLVREPQPTHSDSREHYTRLGSLFFFVSMLSAAVFMNDQSYFLVIGADILIAALFASSLYFLIVQAGMLSFGHAAFFGFAAYCAGLLSQQLGWSFELTLVAAPLISTLVSACIGWFCVRQSGVYLAMLTLAVAQIFWSISYEWEELTGGSNGLVGVWPNEFFNNKEHYFYLVFILVALSTVFLNRISHSHLGMALRSTKDSTLRAKAIGWNVHRLHVLAYMISTFFAALAGVLFAFSKGGISPDTLSIGKSVDVIVMVLLGGIQTWVGPLLGASVFIGLQDTLIRNTEYWRACLGAVILLLVLFFPNGLAHVLYTSCLGKYFARSQAVSWFLTKLKEPK
jgi:branched-chain amino acid transport system permease protein